MNPGDDDDDVDDPSVITIMTTDRKQRGAMTRAYYPATGSLVSVEQSIGDGVENQASKDGEDTTTVADDATSLALDTSLCHFLDQTGIVLQLSSSGGILPMPVVTTKTPTPQSTRDGVTNVSTAKAAREMGGSSSVYQRIMLDEALLLEAGESKTILPIHIACLYQASPAIFELLLEGYSMGCLSAIMGMLPIHLVAARFHLDVLNFRPPITPSLLKSQEDMEQPYPLSKVLQVLYEAMPETLMAKCSRHQLTPLEYMEQGEDGPWKEECLELLNQAQADYESGKLLARHSREYVFSCGSFDAILRLRTQPRHYACFCYILFVLFCCSWFDLIFSAWLITVAVIPAMTASNSRFPVKFIVPPIGRCQHRRAAYPIHLPNPTFTTICCRKIGWQHWIVWSKIFTKRENGSMGSKSRRTMRLETTLPRGSWLPIRSFGNDFPYIWRVQQAHQ